MKRILDVALAGLGLIVVAPLLLVLGVWIKLDSPGPVFYRGIRAGRFGTPFRIYKLRTMVAGAHQSGGAGTASDDPRITRLGAGIRRYKLDELPQLLNVLKGEMSLVGPRPEVLEEVERYSEEEKAVLTVRPGVTDWASIRFCHEGDTLKGRADSDAFYYAVIRPEKMRLQLQYVRHHSLFIDLRILFRTFRRLLLKQAVSVL